MTGMGHKVALALFATLAAADAAAHILSAEFILRMLAEKRRRLSLQELTVQMTTEIDGHDASIEERVYMKPPERMRRVRQDDEIARVVVFRDGQTAEGPEHALKRVKGAPSDLLTALLAPAGEDLEQAQARLVQVLAAQGIDTRTVSLTRNGDGIAFVIGAPPQTPDKAQVWIDKETFLPIKAIVLRKVDGKSVKVEMRWLEFGSSATGEFFPRIIEVYHDGALRERSEVHKVETHHKLPDTLFDLPS